MKSSYNMKKKILQEMNWEAENAKCLSKRS